MTVHKTEYQHPAPKDLPTFVKGDRVFVLPGYIEALSNRAGDVIGFSHDIILVRLDDPIVDFTVAVTADRIAALT